MLVARQGYTLHCVRYGAEDEFARCGYATPSLRPLGLGTVSHRSAWRQREYGLVDFSVLRSEILIFDGLSGGSRWYSRVFAVPGSNSGGVMACSEQ